MKIVEKYTGNRTYMYPNGTLATPEIVLSNYPAILTFPHIIETDENHEVCWAIQNLSAARSMHSIDSALTEAEAIAALQKITNAEPVVDHTPRAEERIAAALEYQNIMTMPDVAKGI